MFKGSFSAELSSLRDVEGVIGSFVVGGTGKIVDRDLPTLFDAETLDLVGVRVQRLLDSLEESPAEGGAHLVLRYAEHKLCLHRAGQVIVGVISEPDASSPTLTMALTLVGRRVNRALGEGPRAALEPSFPTRPDLPAARPPEAGAQAPEGQHASSTASGRPRYFRGKRVD